MKNIVITLPSGKIAIIKPISEIREKLRNMRTIDFVGNSIMTVVKMSVVSVDGIDANDGDSYDFYSNMVFHDVESIHKTVLEYCSDSGMIDFAIWYSKKRAIDSRPKNISTVKHYDNDILNDFVNTLGAGVLSMEDYKTIKAKIGHYVINKYESQVEAKSITQYLEEWKKEQIKKGE